MKENKNLTRRSSYFDDLFNFYGMPFPFSQLRESAFTEGFVELDNKYILKVHIPVVGESLNVSVEKGVVKITYDEKTENSVTKGSYSYSLPEDADASTTDAEIEDNTLKVTVMKRDPSKKIDVKVR